MMCDCAEEQDRRRRDECKDGDCSQEAGRKGDGCGSGSVSGCGSTGRLPPPASWSWSSSAVWLPLMSGSAVLAFVGLLYRSFTSGSIGVWLSNQRQLYGKCRTAIKNTVANNYDTSCEVKIHEKRRKWQLEDRTKPTC